MNPAKNREHDTLNRRISYHKRRGLHFLELLVLNGEDPDLQKKLDYHHAKVRQYKMERDYLVKGVMWEAMRRRGLEL